MKSILQTPEVEFLVQEEDINIPPIIPARKVLPEWFKNLPGKVNNENIPNNSTIKRCAPFLDAMTVGWLIPLAGDVEFTSNDALNGVKYKWDFHKNLVENHSASQVVGNPSEPKPPMKFLNYHFIKMAPGYSALFVPPLNRPDPRFQCIAGMVDDTYMGNGALEYINFPFFFHQPNYTGIIKAGTPLVQLIPIKRDPILAQSEHPTKIQVISADDKALVESTRERRKAQESLYRNELWKRSKQS